MCGIVGHVGRSASQRSRLVVMDGLARLEYRGYDSAGIALVAPGVLDVIRAVGKLANLADAIDEKAPDGALAAIGHTRWATHGRPTVTNAHPHTSADGRFALVHNGIIENADALRQELIADGVSFASDTDTEVVVHLLARTYDAAADAWDGELAGVLSASEAPVRRLVAALRRVADRLQGTFTLLVVTTEAPEK